MSWLARYRVEDSLAVPSPACAAWLTGQSSLRHSGLSPGQVALLEDLAGCGYRPVPGGLPYNSAAMVRPYRPEPIVAASVRNGAQYVAAATSARFGREVAVHVQPVLDATAERLVLLCGSAGAQLLTAALPYLDLPAGLALRVIGLGPVGRLPAPRDGLSVRVVQGARDRISRWGYRGPVDVVVPGGHLDYASHPDVRATVLRLAHRQGR